MSSDSADAGKLQALLDSLRTSPAWVEAVAAPLATSASVTHNNASPRFSDDLHDTRFAEPSPSAPSVATLLSQLRNTSSATASNEPDTEIHRTNAMNIELEHLTTEAPPAKAPKLPAAHHQKDFRTMTLQLSLTHVAKLVEDSEFTQAVKNMKAEQVELEQKLWDERQDIIRRHEEKLKVAKARAHIIGAGGLSKHDAEMLSTAVRRELSRFDLERALPAWDGLVAKHQAAFEVYTVPAMFVTSDPAELKKQKKIMQLLEDVAFGDD